MENKFEDLNLNKLENDVDLELDIRDESVYSLSNELKNHARKEAKYHRLYSQANKRVNDLTLKLEILVAKIVDRIVTSENIPPSGRPEVRRSRVASDETYQNLRRKLNEAIEAKEYLEGLFKTWIGRGYRISELTKLSEYILLPEPKVYKSNNNQNCISTDDEIINSTDMLEY